MSDFSIVIFGYNNIGRDVIEHITRRKQKFVIADFDEQRVNKARSEGLQSYLVDLSNDETLKEAGIGSGVTTVFSLLEEDSVNVFLTISALAIDPELNIISICHSEDADRKLLAAGVSKVINPYQISGRKIYEIIRKPEVVELLDGVVFGQQDLNMVELEIQEKSRLDQTHLHDLNISEDFNLIILGIEDKELGTEMHFASSGINHKLDAGDKLVVIGPGSEIKSFQNKYTAAQI